MLKNLVTICSLAMFSTSATAQDVQLNAADANEELEDALRNASLLLTLDEDALSQDYVAAARADYRRLLTALYAAGRYSGTVSIKIDNIEATDITPLGAPNRINAVEIIITQGPRFTFGRADITPLPTGTMLPESFAPGRTARADRIRQAVETSIDEWRNVGHAKARVTDQQVIARHSAKQLDAVVSLSPGPRLSFGNLNISGNKDVRTARIRAIAGLPTGETFNPETIEKSERRLRRTGAFDSVAFTEAENIGANQTLDINAQIDEAKPRRFGFGLEVSTVEGLTVSTFWLHRNLLGGAERFRVDAEASGIGGDTGGVDYKLGTSFKRPATLDADTDLFATAQISREDEPNFLVDKISAEIGLSRILTDDLTAEVAVGFLSAREESDLGDREYTLLTLPLGATLDKRDNETNAKNGYYIDASGTPFVAIGDGPTGGRFFIDGRAYLSFGEDDMFTLATRGQVGSILGADVDEAPADFLYYSGGGGTVRGQPYQSLGIDVVQGGEVITTGGTSFLGAQLEARVDVSDSIGLVGFYDIGQVGQTAIPGEDAEWHAGAGVGLRYNTGIGPIRLDLGTEASGDDPGSSLQVYIGIGQAF